MSPYITTKNKHTSERSHNVAALHSRLWILANMLLMLLAGLAVVSYLAGLNAVVENGFKLKSLEERLLQSEREEEHLEAALARLRTPAALREATQSLGLVEIQYAAYPKPEAAVALGSQ